MKHKCGCDSCVLAGLMDSLEIVHAVKASETLRIKVMALMNRVHREKVGLVAPRKLRYKIDKET